MSLPDPMPRELTVKQVAERWMVKYGNPVDESYVLGCYGEMQFCLWDTRTASFVDYSRQEHIGRGAEEYKNEEDVVSIMGEFLKDIPEFEKEMLRVRRSDLLAFEKLSRRPEEVTDNMQADQICVISEAQPSPTRESSPDDINSVWQKRLETMADELIKVGKKHLATKGNLAAKLSKSDGFEGISEGLILRQTRRTW